MAGDPQIKARRMRIARQIAMQQMQRDVPRADVIVTNPTHFAVAIQYDQATMAAPKVIAKGADLLALRIRQLAAAHAVPIVERPPLARALYAGIEVGQEISPEHYQAVAEVLAYVYKLEKAAAA
jgi:flagellar biosynthetic protein FlhB